MVNDEREAREQRADNRERERREQVFGRTLQQEHGNEYDADAERRQERRNRDFACARHDRLMQRLVHGDMTLDVLDHDRAVVDQDADRQRETAESHGIQRLTGQIDE